MAKTVFERIDLEPFANALRRAVERDGGPQFVAGKIGIKYSTLISYLNAKSLPLYPMVLVLRNHYPDVVAILDVSVMGWLDLEAEREHAHLRSVLGRTA